MSIAWGPALDAEIAYRHQQSRNDFRRGAAHRLTWHRRAAKPAATPLIPARPDTTGWIVGQPRTQAQVDPRPAAAATASRVA